MPHSFPLLPKNFHENLSLDDEISRAILLDPWYAYHFHFTANGGTTRRPVAKPQFRLSGRDTPRKKGGGGRRKANGIRLKAASTVTASRDCVGGKFFENIFRKRRVYEKTEDQARNFIIISGSSCEIHEIFDTLFFPPFFFFLSYTGLHRFDRWTRCSVRLFSRWWIPGLTCSR